MSRAKPDVNAQMAGKISEPSDGRGTLAQTTPAASSSKAKKPLRKRYEWTAFLYILPAFAVLAVFHIYPVFNAIFISLNKGPINKFTFVGLTNYIRALGSPDFWSSLGTTFVYTLMTLPFAMGLGLFFAYLLYQRIRGKGFFRTVFFLPYVISTVGSAIVWSWVFDPSSGLANQVFKLIGLQPVRWLIEPAGIFQVLNKQYQLNFPAWLHGPSLALIAIAIFSVWQTMGYDIIIFLAGLTNIPKEIYEAARMDGANGTQLFRYITLPLLAPTTFFVLVISVIGSLQSFNQIYAMNTAAAQTLGGPLGTTNTLTVYMFDQLYSHSNFGYASTVAVLLSIVIMLFTLMNFKFFGKRSEQA